MEALTPDEILGTETSWPQISLEEVATQLAKQVELKPMSPVPVFVAGVIGGAVGGAVVGKSVKTALGFLVAGGIAWGAYRWLVSPKPETIGTGYKLRKKNP